MSIRDPRTVVIRPVVSEKSYGSMDAATYRFVVSNDANKVQVRQAIEEIFGVRDQRQHAESSRQEPPQPQ